MLVIDNIETGKNIRRLIESHNLKVADFCDQMHSCSSHTYKWLNGNNIPNIDTCLRIMELFDLKRIEDVIVIKKI